MLRVGVGPRAAAAVHDGDLKDETVRVRVRDRVRDRVRVRVRVRVT